jgi:serine/threonine protein kinase
MPFDNDNNDNYDNDDDNNIIGINGVYKINNIRPLGKGHYSQVYSGININNKSKVAIKVININKLSKDEYNFIKKETIIVKKLMESNNYHENIVKYYDIITTKMNIYIVMELCNNGSLNTILIKPLKKRYYTYYYSQILNGLVFLHNLGIIHSDIKPDNILLCHNYSTIKICDFGFSKLIDNKKNSKKEFKVSCGSPIYMAPEIINGDKCNDKIDLWASGLILYEMIYSEHPCSGLNNMDSISFVVNNILIKKKNNIDIDDEGIKILKKILNHSNRKRINIDEIINSNWLNNNYFNDLDIKFNFKLSNIFYESNRRSMSLSDINIFDDKIKSNSSHSECNSPKNKLIYSGFFDDTRNTERIDIYNKIDNDGYYSDIIFTSKNKKEDKDNSYNDDMIFTLDK